MTGIITAGFKASSTIFDVNDECRPGFLIPLGGEKVIIVDDEEIDKILEFVLIVEQFDCFGVKSKVNNFDEVDVEAILLLLLLLLLVEQEERSWLKGEDAFMESGIATLLFRLSVFMVRAFRGPDKMETAPSFLKEDEEEEEEEEEKDDEDELS